MSNKPSLSHEGVTTEAMDQVLVVDVTRFLSGLAKLHEAEKTGNKGLSRGLRHLEEALRPYANTPVSELRTVLRGRASKHVAKSSSRRPKATLPVHLDSLSHKEIERILGDDSYTKTQISELGDRRFGISRSKLARLSKKHARESVRAALTHERSIDVIAHEARASGQARSA